ncbi:MAG: glycosyltransferase family 2 protein [Candidatus Stahlbacteria bacterium]|nr:glycosyltransferase family 2 protein [Candidatus Stahlbacteria bacterium]
MKDFVNNIFPFVSIIIPCRNEEKYIERCLDSILKNDYPKDKLEIFVVDGMSTDKTVEIIKEFTQKYSFIKVLDNPKRFQVSAFNIGIKKAVGEIVIIMGSHTIYAPDYISKCVSYLLQENISCVGGVCGAYAGKETYIADAIAFALSASFGVGNAYFRIGSEKPKEVDTVPFGCYKREVFDRIGLFDEEFVVCQDDEFNYRLRKKGGKILLVPDIKSYYYARSTLIFLWRQYFRYGIWKVRVFQKHPHMMQVRQFIPGLFVFGLLFIISISIFISKFLWVLGFNVLTYLIGAFFFSSKIAKKYGWKYLSFMPVVFATLHISYGSGFLIGLVKFAHRWRTKVKCQSS